MAANLDTEGQLKFLITCIRCSVAGQPDFAVVADELGIVTKAAAAKRYERLIKDSDTPSKCPVLGVSSPAASHGNSAAAARDSTSATPMKRAAKRRTLPAGPEEEEKKSNVRRTVFIVSDEDDDQDECFDESDVVVLEKGVKTKSKLKCRLEVQRMRQKRVSVSAYGHVQVEEDGAV